MNRWTDGGWGQRSGAPTEVLSGESLGGSGGVAEVFSHKKRGPIPFHLEPGQQDLCHVPKKLQPYSSIVSEIGQSGAINMLHYSLYSSQIAACVQCLNTNKHVNANFDTDGLSQLL